MPMVYIIENGMKYMWYDLFPMHRGNHFRGWLLLGSICQFVDARDHFNSFVIDISLVYDK